MDDLSHFYTCINTNKSSKMLSKHNCIDNTLLLLLKHRMDITARKAAYFRSVLELYQTWSSSNKDLQSYIMTHKSKKAFGF